MTEKSYERILLKEIKSLPEVKLKELADFAEFLSLKEILGFGRLAKRTKEAAERKGYKPGDVDKLISELRHK